MPVIDAETVTYIHRWRVPIVVVVNGVSEHWYYAPYYDRRLLPVVQRCA